MRIFKKKFRGFSKFSKIEFWWRQIFENLIIHKSSLGSREIPQKNLGPIGSAVLTFIGYKQTDRQTNKQTDKPNLYIDVEILFLDIKLSCWKILEIKNKQRCEGGGAGPPWAPRNDLWSLLMRRINDLHAPRNCLQASQYVSKPLPLCLNAPHFGLH